MQWKQDVLWGLRDAIAVQDHGAYCGKQLASKLAWNFCLTFDNPMERSHCRPVLFGAPQNNYVCSSAKSCNLPTNLTDDARENLVFGIPNLSECCSIAITLMVVSWPRIGVKIDIRVTSKGNRGEKLRKDLRLTWEVQLRLLGCNDRYTSRALVQTERV